MDEAEFDKFANEYHALHAGNIKASGEEPAFFAEYKVKDVAKLLRAAGLPQAMDMLDFGAGVGNSVPFFRRHLPGCRLTCLDVSAKSMAIAKQRFPGQARYATFDGSVFPFADASFDVVYSACVFHHIPAARHEWYFREIGRVLRENGLFIVFEHNPYNPLTVRAVNSCPFDENAELVRPVTMMRRIRSAGLGVATRRYRIFFPGFVRFLRGLENYLAWLPLGAQYYVVSRKGSGH